MGRRVTAREWVEGHGGVWTVDAEDNYCKWTAMAKRVAAQVDAEFKERDKERDKK